MNATYQTRPAVRKSLQQRLRRTATILTLLLVPLAIGLLILLGLPDPPDLRLMYAVQPGMTEAEVVAVFGQRPTTDQPWQVAKLAPLSAAQGTAKYWYCDAGIVRVMFGQDGRVRGRNQFSYGFGGEHPTKTKLRSALRWVGLASLVP
jgi:hypothetical protein